MLILILLYLTCVLISVILNIGIMRGYDYKEFYPIYEEIRRDTLGFATLISICFPIISLIVAFFITGFAGGGLRYD